MNYINFEITKELLKDEKAMLSACLIDLQTSLTEQPYTVEFWFAPDTTGMRTGAIKFVEKELTPNVHKLIYRDPNGKRQLRGLDGRPKCKKLKPHGKTVK